MTTILLALLLSAAAQQPTVTNGTVQPRAAGGNLPQEIRAIATRETQPVWIGYAVPAHRGDQNMCCWNSSGGSSCCMGCRLEPGSANAVTFSGSFSGATPLEPGDVFFVLYRVEQGAVMRIRTFSENCPLDAGGRTIHWLTGVRGDDSVAYLSSFITAPATTTKIADSALSALAMHREPSALERLVAAARDGATTHIRGQALFWLGQRAGEKAVGAISEAIARDPETEVKKRAVFALSQLPKDEGVPLLIQVARTNTNPAVRKQAMFWLGQTRDPRALRFFEEILFK